MGNDDLQTHTQQISRAIAEIDKAHLLALLENTSDLIWAVDTDLCLLLFNTHFATIIEYTKKQIPKVGDSIFDYIPAGHHARWKELYRMGLSGATFTVEETVTNGKTVVLDVSLNPIRVNGRITGVALQGHDITERKRKEEKLRENNTELGRLNRELQDNIRKYRELLKAVTHDMTEAMGDIKDFATLISQQAKDSSPIVALTENIFETAQHQLKHILEISQNNRIILSLDALEKHPVNLGFIINTRLPNHQRIAEQKGQKITADIQENCIIEADHSKIALIIDNLLSNAVRYSPEGKVIHVEIKCDNESVIMRVVDDGFGLSEEDKEIIFGKSGQKKPEAGSESSFGLGLLIVKQVVELHSGSVWLEDNENGSGTTFVIRFPRQQFKVDEREIYSDD